MIYKLINLPITESRSEPVYVIEENKLFENGKVTSAVSFYITEEGLWNFKERNGIASNSPDVIAGIFASNIYPRARSSFLSALKALCAKVGTFPSPQSPAREFYLIVGSVKENTQSIFRRADNYGSTVIFLTLPVFKLPDLEIANNIIHELLHVIAEIEQGQKEFIKQMIKFAKTAAGPIESEREMVGDAIEALRVQVASKEGFFDEQETWIKLEFLWHKSGSQLWNYIIDSGLCTLAIEFGMHDFVHRANDADREALEGSRKNSLKSDLAKILSIRQIMDREENPRRKANLALLDVLEFITCFEFMPAYGTPAAMLIAARKGGVYQNVDGSLEALENLQEFRRIVSKSGSLQVSKGFFFFYNQYLEMLKAQGIFPLREGSSVKNFIYNDRQQELSRLCYQYFYQEFNKFLRRFQEEEALISA